MFVLALVYREDIPLITAVLAAPKRLQLASSMDDLQRWLHCDVPHLCIIDPTVFEQLCSEGTPPSWLHILARLRSLPVVLFASRGLGTAETRTELMKLRPVGFAVRGVDAPSTLRDILHQASSTALTTLVLQPLSEHLDRLDRRIERALYALFAEPPVMAAVVTLAEQAGVPRREFDRQLRNAGLASAKRLIAASRTVQAYALLQAPGSTVSTVARHMRYCSRRPFATDTQMAVSLTPRELRHLPQDEFVDRITQRLIRSAT